MNGELAAAHARRQQYLAARQELERAERDLEHKQQLAARWRREVGTLAERLEAASGPLSRLRAAFGGGGQRAQLEADLAEARAKHDAADDEIPGLERARDRATAEVQALADASATFAELLAAREVELRERGGELAERLEQSSARLFALEEERTLLARTVQLGRDAEGELLVAKQCLQRARQALGADVIGGVVATGRVPVLADAERHLQAAGRKLERMGEELHAQAAVMQRITFPNGHDLAGMVFDRMPHDLYVHRRIHQATDDVTATIEQLRTALWAAEAAHKRIEASARAASDERAAWIVAVDG
ncbi:MAG: hypothetical protein ACE37K_12390 [Planctomycetota bacterium]